MGIQASSARTDSAGGALREAFIDFMQKIGLPNGLKAVGYSSSDIPALTEGTLKQKRLIGLSPRSVTRDAVYKIFEESLAVW
jgi:hydroxyacid-oxoacid transhydrogenase